MRLFHGLGNSGGAEPIPEHGFTKRNEKLGHANMSGAWPLRAASDESLLDPFSAALRSVSCLVKTL